MANLSIAPYLPFGRVRLVDQRVTPGVPETFVRVEPDDRFAPICSGCGSQVRSIHSTRTRTVRDLKLGAHDVRLGVTQRRLRCSTCKATRMEMLDFVDPHQRVTRRLARYIADLCRVMSVLDVARHLGIDWKLVKACDKAVLEEEVGSTDTTGLRLLAVDEISIKKRHHYMTVVLDYETGRVVWMGEHRRFTTLSQFFRQMTPAERAGIEAVAMDMWPAYEKAVRAYLPNARIVYDQFHIVAAYNLQVMDKVRTSASRKAKDDEERGFIRGSRFLLYKNPENLSGDEPRRLEQLLEVNAAISTAHVLKDQLKQIWTIRQPWAARRALRQWCALAVSSGIPPLIRFAARLKRHERGIVAHARFPIHTGRLEGVNNRIKVIKRKAYGFHDPDYFILKVKQAFPGSPCT